MRHRRAGLGQCPRAADRRRDRAALPGRQRAVRGRPRGRRRRPGPRSGAGGAGSAKAARRRIVERGWLWEENARRVEELVAAALASTARKASSSPRRTGRFPPVPSCLNAFSVDVEDYFQVAGFEGVIARAVVGQAWSAGRREQHARDSWTSASAAPAPGDLLRPGLGRRRWPPLVREIREGWPRARLARPGPPAGVFALAGGVPHRRRRSKGSSRMPRVSGRRLPGADPTRSSASTLDRSTSSPRKVSATTRASSRSATTATASPTSPRFPRPLRGHNGTALDEAPISTVRLAGMNLPFVGGGYLRHFPFLWSTAGG